MIEIVAYNALWAKDFLQQKEKIQNALEGNALAVHHIGSTSVPHLAAKNIIDIQVTVAEFTNEIERGLNRIGYKRLHHILSDHRPQGYDHLSEKQLSKWFFISNEPAVNLHVRLQHSFNQRYALLCRDYLRAHPYAAKAYEEIKKQLAKHFQNDIDAYYDIKDPVFDVIMSGAELWSEKVGWKPQMAE
ncbi:hypothetical protein OK18_04215 [Chryseobacterium gallinarum]|uniref:GrpB family protein n=1 Tax=Chryseobacterium gallinarum TaxID=1324352 RepID=A0A0G3LZY7_CHRGL|nr:GrpB family protein [Chryseobacterium gallinarum]AKK71950.1 hypothetical protein OK18_04215 [Chryseobacterium gallinarum]